LALQQLRQYCLESSDFQWTFTHIRDSAFRRPTGSNYFFMLYSFFMLHSLSPPDLSKKSSAARVPPWAGYFLGQRL
jgi:hypothetical protein